MPNGLGEVVLAVESSPAAMNDPWNVKTRRGHQYQSCMKINGIPLLPPVLSKECRKEMLYYKLLAKEVEKRISHLQPYVETDTDEDRTDAPELPECETQAFEIAPDNNLNTTIDFVVDKYSTSSKYRSQSNSPNGRRHNTKTAKIKNSQIVIDLNLKISEKEKRVYTTRQTSPLQTQPERPERDCSYTNKKEKELLFDYETDKKKYSQKDVIDQLVNFDFKAAFDGDCIPIYQDGPSSLSSKSFTGSLQDIHAESSKDSDVPTLIRQRSYTVLKPSPQLLAHLEVQSLNTGVELNTISMSESTSNLVSSNKKRKSWDLESAKVKWSSMAMELKNKNIVPRPKANSTSNKMNSKIAKKIPQISSTTKSYPTTQDKTKKVVVYSKSRHSEPLQKATTVQNPKSNVHSEKTVDQEPKSLVNKSLVKSSPSYIVSQNGDNFPKNTTVALISGAEDPAIRVRELYEKLQKQHLMQMATLMDKQKREQQLLQQVFEEQNIILLKQLKTVCPKASIEVKQAWGDLKDDPEPGPVSLSQLINNTPSNSIPNSPLSKTLTQTSSCLKSCDSVLKKSRDITSNIKKQTQRSRSKNGITHNQKASDQIQVTRSVEGSKTRTNSPARNTSRKLNYDTSVSSDYDPVLTDRTNDTMADLNVTFPSDNSDEYPSYVAGNRMSPPCKSTATRACSPPTNPNKYRATDDAIKNLENSIQKSITSSPHSRAKQSIIYRTPTDQELVAATKIVAYAKGWLVRRLMKTDRIQATVQTIRDALLCALQLHQDREGIRGADVDLHRRLIQQITAACYTLHDTFVSSSPTERCALITADRARRAAAALKQATPTTTNRRHTKEKDVDSCDNSQPMTSDSEQETFSNEKTRQHYMPNPQRVPWR